MPSRRAGCDARPPSAAASGALPRVRSSGRGSQAAGLTHEAQPSPSPSASPSRAREFCALCRAPQGQAHPQATTYGSWLAALDPSASALALRLRRGPSRSPSRRLSRRRGLAGPVDEPPAHPMGYRPIQRARPPRLPREPAQCTTPMPNPATNRPYNRRGRPPAQPPQFQPHAPTPRPNPPDSSSHLTPPPSGPAACSRHPEPCWTFTAAGPHPHPRLPNPSP